jgi:hypothetical protein
MASPQSHNNRNSQNKWRFFGVKPISESNQEESTEKKIEYTKNSQKKESIFYNLKTWYKCLSNADRISFFSVFVNAIIAIATLAIVTATIHQSRNSDKSVDLSERVFKSTDSSNKITILKTEQFDDTTLSMQKQSLDSQIAAKKESDTADAGKLIREIALFKLQKTADSTQIAALKETQNEFNKQNDPYLQIDLVNQEPEFKDGVFKIYFEISNLRETPVKILERKGGVYTKKASKVVNYGDVKLHDVGDLNAYVIKGSPLQRKGFGYNFRQTEIDSINNGAMNVFLIINIKYKNLISNEIKYYACDILIYHNNNGWGCEYIYNENTFVKYPTMIK